MKLFFIGDVHGEWHKLEHYQRSVQPDLCLLVGDVETVRDESDLEEMTGPDKYIHVGDFPEYYEGDRTLPVETWFIGGNHEVWSYLHEHNPDRDNDPRLIENLFYFGRAGIRTINGLTIAYLTGIYSSKHYENSSEERLKWCEGMDWQKSRATGYYREDEVERIIEQASSREIDLLLTHDWPKTTEFDRENLNEDLLGYGNPIETRLNRLLEPTLHVAGHIHRGIHATIEDRDFYGLGRLGSEYGQDGLVVNTKSWETQWTSPIYRPHRTENRF